MDKSLKQLRYIGQPILDFPVSLWSDGKLRIISPITGKVVRTFRDEAEVEEYRRFLKDKSQARLLTAITRQVVYAGDRLESKKDGQVYRLDSWQLIEHGYGAALLRVVREGSQHSRYADLSEFGLVVGAKS